MWVASHLCVNCDSDDNGYNHGNNDDDFDLCSMEKANHTNVDNWFVCMS